ncbi:MAG: hypothetical protein B6I20_13245 [Bacteroidetes bacterium 4572_117]|nr:MAG: hypothetical protein B6I20_13245 [Bacteroidetes bacterium 4572_117]
MKKIYLFVLLAIFFASCEHTHEHETPSDDGHNHGDVKIQYTVYSNEFELFAEADPFVVGEEANVLSHFSHLPEFTALETGSMTIRLIVNGKETKQTLEKASRKGIYSFYIEPETEGKGLLKFDIKTEKGEFQLIVKNIVVFNDGHDAIHYAEDIALAENRF